VEDIGTWFTILEIVSVAAVLTNSGLVAFTGDNTINYPWFSRIWIFFGMTAGILVMKFLIAINVPDSPLDVEIQLERNAYYVDKIIYNKPDDDNELTYTKVENKFVVRVNDDDPL
jgi:hypothetical protein